MRYGSALLLWLAPVAAFGQPYAFVGSAAGDAVAVIDLASETMVGSLPVGGIPSAAAMSPDGSRLFVTQTQLGALTRIDTATGSSVTIAVGSAPSGVAMDPSGQRVYVANTGADTVSVVNALATPPLVVATIPVGDAPMGIVADGGLVYVANWGANRVSMISTATLSLNGSVAVGTFPAALALDPAAGRLYVANFMDDTVSVVDTTAASVLATVPVGAKPRGLALDPVAGRLFVAGFESNDVQVVDTATNQVVLQGPSQGKNPNALFLSPDSERLYALHLETGKSIAVLDAASLAPLSAIEAPPGPVAMVGSAPQPPPLTKRWAGAPTFFRGLVGPAASSRPAPARRRAIDSIVEIFDGTFSPSNWEMFVQGEASTTQEVSGGNPGSWRRTIHFGPAVTGHRYTAYMYDPGQEAIGTIDFSWDRRLLARSVALESAAVFQNGVAYRTTEHAIFVPTWDHESRTGLHAENFDDGSGGHPDFSAAGSPLSFGYYRRTSTGQTLAHGIDNFRVVLYSSQNPGGELRFRETVGVVQENDAPFVEIWRVGGSQGAITVDVLTERPNGSTDTDTLSWPDGDMSPRSILVLGLDLPPGSGCRTARMTLVNLKGGASLDPQRSKHVIIVYPMNLGPALLALVLALQPLLSAVSPAWLLALSAPAALAAWRSRRRARRR